MLTMALMCSEAGRLDTAGRRGVGFLQREACDEEGGFHRERGVALSLCFPSGSGFGEREVGFDQVSRPRGEHAPCSEAGVSGSALPERRQETSSRKSSSVWFVAAVISGSGDITVPAGTTQSPNRAPPSSPRGFGTAHGSSLPSFPLPP